MTLYGHGPDAHEHDNAWLLSLIETFEREYLIAVLNECGGIIYRAAKLAGMSERGFHQKLRHYGIDGTGFRSGT